MRVTMLMLDLETQLTEQLLTDARGWRWWRDVHTTRKLHRPGHLAIHEPTGAGVAIYTRPHRPYPSEAVTPMSLPAGIEPAVWHPRLRPQITAWLNHPTGPPPGHLTPKEQP